MSRKMRTICSILQADYVEAGEEKKASKLCKKLIRLFQNGESVEYAKRFLDAIGDGKAKDFLKQDIWEASGVYKHLKEEKPTEEKPLEKPSERPLEKSSEEDAPAVKSRKSLADVLGMRRKRKKKKIHCQSRLRSIWKRLSV